MPIEQPNMDARQAYAQLFNSGEQKGFISIREAPMNLTMPLFVSDYMRDILQRTTELNIEYQGMIEGKNNHIATSEIMGGGAHAIGPEKIIWRAIFGEPAVIHIHSHPRRGDDPVASPQDIASYRALQYQAYAFSTVSDTGVSLLLQTKESLRFPIWSFANGIIARAIAEEIVDKAAKKLWKESHGDEKFDRHQAYAEEYMPAISREYGKRIYPLFQRLRLAYYRYEGNILESSEPLILKRVTQG
jgi:hypothetical protein